MLTLPDYVIGYLYISPILFAKPRLSRSTTLLITEVHVHAILHKLGVGDRDR
jgi:hypothetical protein